MPARPTVHHGKGRAARIDSRSGGHTDTRALRSSGAASHYRSSRPDFIIDVGNDGYGFLNHDTFKAAFAADAASSSATRRYRSTCRPSGRR
ncbi:hypothetical protein [Micromonospora maris]|uniref:Uncharacterized protein n=1 Tax=Micromonospora maris TaxID=1003110 RepID=A0A9X0LBJ5_9ACTN|nr:hypothetical protein [Micromonospora maris]KUJ44109.1 hypothetical protein ADL17_12775 [Micromonospora maris]